MILQGQITPGTRLPASRKLANMCGVARITVSEAYEQLRVEGFVVSRTGSGTFVADDLPELASPNRQPVSGAGKRPFLPTFSDWGDRVLSTRHKRERPLSQRPPIDFGFGRSFPHIFPYDVWRKLLARYLSTDDVMLSRFGSVAGFLPLRQALATYLQRLRGVVCEPEQIVIVNGAQQAIDILARLFLRPNDEVLMETPGYSDAYALFRVHGAHVTTLAVDDLGLPIAQIPPDSQAKLLFVTPSNQFPRGGTMPLVRRLTLLNWAKKRNALIIEDDYDGALRYDNRPLSALQGLDNDGRVIYLGTFSKVLFPALRLSYVVLPQALVSPFLQAKGLIDRGAPTLTQAAVSDFITEGHFERHLRLLRRVYGKRRACLVRALENKITGRIKYAPDEAGLHVMLYLAQTAVESEVVRRAAEVGVGVYPGAGYHLQKPAPPSILLGFSGLTEADIEEGIRLLATIL
ncbi:MAG: PLP-dependent aminotransferase family protein [Chloroflexi bacterium]|nr:PLP-dependent aminotransferase family protein [Chloroflexota bacterium]